MAKLHENNLKELVEAHNKGIVLGLKGVAGIVPRLDIDVLLHDYPKTFNLYVLAFDELQQKSDINDRMGYFQIAGIHGAPKAEWDNMGVKQNIDSKAGGEVVQAGYCAHGVETFPTWHRTYLGMLEQTIFLKMVEIAKRYDTTHRAEYLDAVAQFRLPFWDYFRPRGGAVEFPGVGGVVDKGSTSFPYDYSLPRIFTEKTISARFYPNNELKSLGRNPFHSHKFSDEEASKIEWNIFANDPNLFPRNRTVRYHQPNSKDNLEDVKTMNSVLNELRMDSNRLVLTMLGDKLYGKYDAFATNRQGPKAKAPSGSVKEATKFVYDWPSGSLEALHGLYHVVVGGSPFPRRNIPGGHMTRVSVAAFDPVFWMHHGQIERLFAFWQAIHKGERGAWFSDSELADQDLLPFRKPNKENNGKICWNSNDCLSTEQFGYTYAELSAGKDVKKHVNDLYQWSIPLTDAGKFGPIPREMEPLDLSKSEFFKTPGQAPNVNSALLSSIQPVALQQVQAVLQPERQIVTSTSEPEFSREWYIDDEVERLALNGAFTIFYFVKDNNDPISADSDYILEPSLAGLTHIFAAPEELCDNCGLQNQQSVVVTNTVPITSLLLDYIKEGQLESLRPEHVKPFLTRGLKWRIVSVNAETQDPRNMAAHKGYSINISCKKPRLPRDSGDVSYENYPEIFQDIVAQASATPTTSTG